MASREGSDSFSDRNVSLIIQDRAGEVLAVERADVCHQFDPRPIWADQVDVQVGRPRMGDVKHNVKITDTVTVRYRDR